MRLDELLGDEEAQSQPAGESTFRNIASEKFFKNPFLLIVRNPDAIIRYRENNRVIILLQIYFYRTFSKLLIMLFTGVIL